MMPFFSSLLPSKPTMHPFHSLSRAWTHFSLTVVARIYVRLFVWVCTFSNAYTYIHITYMCIHTYMHICIDLFVYFYTVTCMYVFNTDHLVLDN